MHEGEVRLILNWMAFWGALILSELAHGWWSVMFGVGAVISFVICLLQDRTLYPPEPRKGFWSKVWRR